jgi:hypothetical protein
LRYCQFFPLFERHYFTIADHAELTQKNCREVPALLSQIPMGDETVGDSFSYRVRRFRIRRVGTAATLGRSISLAQDWAAKGKLAQSRTAGIRDNWMNRPIR